MGVLFACFIFALIVFAVIVVVSAKKWGNLKQMIESITPTKLAKYFVWMVLVVFLFIAGILGRYLTHFDGDLSLENGDWGTFGDYLGGTLNPILSFLSLIALLTTIVLQSKELELTRNELELTRDELKRSAEAQEATKDVLYKQSETLKKQQFESTFFSLLDQHNKVLESLTIFPGNGTKSKLIEVKESVFGHNILDLGTANTAIKLKNNLCGHYFRALYQLLKFVFMSIPDSTTNRVFDADKIKKEELTNSEKMYSNIVRSFLGHDITELLSINCYCNDPKDTYWKYKCLIERYAFLEHMPFDETYRSKNILEKTIDSYDICAFGDNEYVSKYIANKELTTQPV